MDQLLKFQKALKDAERGRVKVGVLGDKTTREGSAGGGDTNAEIGAKMEFGFVQDKGPWKGFKIPARSFLRFPLLTFAKNVPAQFKADAVKLLLSARIDLLLKRIGVLAVKAIDYAFQTRGMGMWKANSPVTILLKGSDAPLIDTGQLRRSISYQVTGVKK